MKITTLLMSLLSISSAMNASAGINADRNLCFPVKQGNNQIAVCAMPTDLGTAVSFSGFYILTQSGNRIPFVTFHGQTSIQSNDQPSLFLTAQALCSGFSNRQKGFLNIDASAPVRAAGLFLRADNNLLSFVITPTLPNGNIPVPGSTAQYLGGQIVQLVCQK